MIIPLGAPRYFRMPDGTEVPVKEAPWPLPVLPTDEDIANATAGDPYNCMYAVNIKRVWNARFVAVERGVCGVVMKDEDGNLCFYRWLLTPRAKDEIKKFDAGEKPKSHAVEFRPPTASETLAAKAYAHLDWELKQERLKKKKPHGAHKKKPSASKPARKAHVTGSKHGLSVVQSEGIAMVETLRKSGKGMFQFRPIIS